MALYQFDKYVYRRQGHQYAEDDICYAQRLTEEQAVVNASQEFVQPFFEYRNILLVLIFIREKLLDTGTALLLVLLLVLLLEDGLRRTLWWRSLLRLRLWLLLRSEKLLQLKYLTSRRPLLHTLCPYQSIRCDTH